MRLFSRAVAIALSLLLAGANGAVCAGWAATPEARMACCVDDCPMHEGGSDASTAHPVLTQSAADACCAVSEHDTSDTSNPTAIVSLSAAVPGLGVVLHAHAPTHQSIDGWRTHAARVVPPVPRHILLSVFLV